MTARWSVINGGATFVFGVFIVAKVLQRMEKVVSLPSGKQNVLNQSFPIIELCVFSHIVYVTTCPFFKKLVTLQPPDLENGQ